MTAHLLRPLCWLTVLAIVLAPATAADDVWAKYASDNFVVFTASSKGKAEKVLQHLERVRRAYSFLLDAELDGEQPVNVLLFKNKKEYLDYAPSETSDAYYTQALGQDFIIISDFSASIEVVLNHEYFHLYSRHQGFNWPTWAGEGIADYFSTLRLAKKALDQGLPVDNHLLYLNNTSRKLTVENLFAMGREQRHTAARGVVNDLYAMSWALVHMVFSDYEQSTAMIEALQAHQNSATAFEQVYGWSIGDIDDALQEYLGRSTLSYRRLDVEEGHLTFDAPVVPAQIQEWEAPLLLADVLANARKYDEADAEYKRLGALFPDVPGIDDSRALLLMRQGEQEDATPVLRSAVAKGSVNPITYRYMARRACSDSAAPECLELLSKAVELAPEDKELQLFNISVLNQAEQFRQALLLANTVTRLTTDEAPMFFYQKAYAQYRMGQAEDAKKSIAAGKQHAVSSVDFDRLRQLGEAIDRPPRASMIAMPVPISDGGRPTLSRPAPAPSGFPTASAPAVESVVQRLMNSLIADGATLTTATLTKLECSSATPILTVETELGAMNIVIDDPSLVSIVQDGEMTDDYQFTCGPQSGETIRVGYARSTDGTPGVFLRLLQFGEI